MGQGKIGFGKCVLLTVISQILMIGLACVLMFCFRGQSIGDLLFPRRSWGEICLYGLAVAVAAAVAVGGVYRIFSPLRRSVAPVLHSMKEEFVLPGLLFMGIGSALGEEILFRECCSLCWGFCFQFHFRPAPYGREKGSLGLRSGGLWHRDGFCPYLSNKRRTAHSRNCSRGL